MVKLKRTKRFTDLSSLLLAVVIIVLLNFISSFVFTRIDLTSEKRFTLSPATKDLVGKLDDVVYVKIYLEGDFPSGFRRLRNSTQELLDELKAYSGDNIEYEFINPSEGVDDADLKKVYRQLAEKGLQPTNIQQKGTGETSEQIIFPGAILTYKNAEIPLQLLKSQIGAAPEEMLNNSIESLEYDLAKAIRDVTAKSKPKLGFLGGHGELDDMDIADIARTLNESYEVKRVRIDGLLNALDGLKALIIARPDSAFNEKDKFVIDQFIMKGGKVIWLIDGISASMDSLQKRPTTVAIATNHNLEDQLFRYGVRINANLLMDLQSAPIPIVTGYTGNQPQQKLMPWFFFPLISSNINHPIVNNLNAIKTEFVSSIDTVSAQGVKKTCLLTTSQYTRQMFAPVRIGLNIIKEEPDIRQYNKPRQVIAVLLEGRFKSVFTNRIPAAISNSSEIKFKEESVENKMMVISDGDLIKNMVRRSAGQVLPLGYDRFTGQTYGNKNFILNAVDYLCDDSGLISVRSKEIKLRLLDRTKVNDERFKWQLINTLLPILLVVIFGIIQGVLRKRKYAR